MSSPTGNRKEELVVTPEKKQENMERKLEAGEVEKDYRLGKMDPLHDMSSISW